jgi:hypothetical protein
MIIKCVQVLLIVYGSSLIDYYDDYKYDGFAWLRYVNYFPSYIAVLPYYGAGLILLFGTLHTLGACVFRKIQCFLSYSYKENLKI